MSTIGERPGVYASYEVINASYSGTPRGTCGIAAACAGGSGEIKLITSPAAAKLSFGESNLTKLIEVLFKNGAAAVKAVGIADGGSYKSAFELLCAEEDVSVILCDKNDAATAKLIDSAIKAADGRKKYKIGIVESDDSTVDALSDFAASLNSERMVLVAPAALDEDGKSACVGTLAAAFCGALLLQSDPAVPLNGAELFGIGGISADYNDGDVNALVRAGITPVECVGGKVCVIRGITTRTETDGQSDPTYREITTVRIIDDVLPTVENALRSAFSRTKNTAQTRGAIRTRVIVELEKKLAAEIIDSYGNVSVKVNDSDPTVCDVGFDFTVAHGLNQIRISAHIAV